MLRKSPTFVPRVSDVLLVTEACPVVSHAVSAIVSSFHFNLHNSIFHLKVFHLLPRRNHRCSD